MNLAQRVRNINNEDVIYEQSLSIIEKQTESRFVTALNS